MSISDDLHTLFKARREVLEILDGKPTYADLHFILEQLAKLLYHIQFDKEGGKHNLIGLIIDKSNYTKRFGAPFSGPNRPAIYDEFIADGATGVIRAKTAEAIHRARITEWDAFEAVDREARSFIVDAFEEAWYSELCNAVSFYKRVTTRWMLERLQGICVGNHVIDILYLQEKMRVMHIEHDLISQYIWALEEAQQQAARAGMPITDSTLVMIATKAMLVTHRFPTTNKKLKELQRSVQTWGKCKDLYKKSEKQARVKRQAAGGQDQFGGSVIEARAGGAATPGRRGTPVTIDEL